ncbi:putative membrane protein [Vibrio parahaemolyticus AQ3810]|nr:putative membrane protein [Vibrio parahaemolyticus AQ3810]
MAMSHLFVRFLLTCFFADFLLSAADLFQMMRTANRAF